MIIQIEGVVIMEANQYEMILKRLDEIVVITQNNELRLEKIEELLTLYKTKKYTLMKVFLTLGIITLAYCSMILYISFFVLKGESTPIELAVFVLSFFVWELNNQHLDNTEWVLEKDGNLSPRIKKSIYKFKVFLLGLISSTSIIIIIRALS